MKSIVLGLYLTLNIIIFISCQDQILEHDNTQPIKLKCFSDNYKDCMVVASEVSEEPVNKLITLLFGK